MIDRTHKLSVGRQAELLKQDYTVGRLHTRSLMRPELTTAPVVRALYIEHDRHLWTTLHCYQPASDVLIYKTPARP